MHIPFSVIFLLFAINMIFSVPVILRTIQMTVRARARPSEVNPRRRR